MPPDASRFALSTVRGLIDGADDALLALIAARRGLVSLAAGIKRESGHAPRDPAREQHVRRRARRLGALLGLPAATSERLIALLIQDACRQQGLADDRAALDLDQRAAQTPARMLGSAMDTTPAPAWLRLLPPPARLAPLVRCLPSRLQARALESALRQALEAPLRAGTLDILAGRRIGIEVSDLELRWVVALRDGRLRVCAPDEAAEATVRGSATDLLLLASRREDADTLFFQRRLVLTGDTELGLVARNLLDQLVWQDIPLALRIVLHRGAGFAAAARAAFHSTASPGSPYQ